MTTINSRFSFQSSSDSLTSAIAWAKQQALRYVFEGDPVGLWYEAALPGRQAFCMRDVAHMSTGAAVLGLEAHTKNMLLQFARHISDSKDWCTYWEMTREGLPCPDDYTDDRDFWYNLPANFDLVDCCWRQYQWTGDCEYVEHESFLRFYGKSLNDYVQRWDRDGDGIPDHVQKDGRRGIASYVEDATQPKVGGDLLAAQYAAYVAYSRIALKRGQDRTALRYKWKAEHLQNKYEAEWWDDSKQRYYGAMLQSGEFYSHYYNSGHYLPLYYGLAASVERQRLALQDIVHSGVSNVEEMSYLPDVLYRFGEKDKALETLLQLCDPATLRRDYPEVSFTVIGNLITGLMGIRPNADKGIVKVKPQIHSAIEWVRAEGISLFQNRLSIECAGGTVAIRNEEGPPINVTFGNQTTVIGAKEEKLF